MPICRDAYIPLTQRARWETYAVMDITELTRHMHDSVRANPAEHENAVTQINAKRTAETIAAPAVRFH